MQTSNFKVEFQLEQQTPIIHFQHGQKGACLRGSEVKPKLDKFILECLGREKVEKEGKIQDDLIELRKLGSEKAKENNWLLPEEDKALKYKIHIRAVGTPEISETIMAEKRYVDTGKRENGKRKINGLYFGNMVSRWENGKQKSKEQYKQEVEEKYKETVFYKANINATIICFCKPLCEYIKAVLPAFFVLHNFGTRQDKGFGSFKVVKVQGEEINDDAIKIVRKYREKSYYIQASKDKDYKWLKESGCRLSQIERIYKLMKGGIPQQKGFIQTYYSGKSYRKELYTRGKIKFARIHLGMAESYCFLDKKNVFVAHKYITRYPSPIDFKIIDKYIFLIPKPMPKVLKDEPNIYYKDTRYKKKDKIGPLDKSLKMDTAFDIYDFLKVFSYKYKELKPVLERENKGGNKDAK